ncbi:hypothetical protein ACI8B_210081 [Acinetobacter proteolyticus]|uniref:Uncharacterized protein n=1 Tax=Acinetobacter proteolyticus TaxID=1776741 RepID=A0A653K424_9GAMM|nr:hypothetical protein ACI8B_210081 [Acinetobacter proteolyticus]
MQLMIHQCISSYFQLNNQQYTLSFGMLFLIVFLKIDLRMSQSPVFYYQNQLHLP